MSATITLETATERVQWVAEVEAFCAQLAEWSHSQCWQVSRRMATITEADLGVYPAPVLTITTPRGVVIAEPVARTVMGATGRIDLYAYPTLFRVMLLRRPRDGEWRIRTDLGIFLKRAWNAETFISLVADLTGASDESSAD